MTAASLLESDPILREMVDRLVTRLAPLRVHLYGSRARGDQDEDSDYDFLVVVEDSDQPLVERCVAGLRALVGMGVSKDVVVYTREEMAAKLRAFSSLPSTAMREGTLLYEQ